ncbi:SAM-dependent methyltransferase [Streptomyces tateyamensis]|uniref:SAM-dependent methyltransferase n=1 Tax=Streptomyces tateyamensis TaxID=565073 RepID=UPI001FE7634D|nr:SAM-dependent methyltransferase [Streptomyces tateyamensis]
MTDLQSDRPHPARIYDYWLGGKDNFPPDREAAEQAIGVSADIPAAARENRAFLQRAVRLLAEAGIRQFVDIGAGLPSPGNVHEVAQAVDPASRVVYVDNDPIVLTHGRALLADNRSTTVFSGDVRKLDELFEHPELQALVDFAQPVGMLLVAVLHFVTDEEAQRAVAQVLEKVAPGSYLVISNSTHEGNPERAAAAAKTWDKTATPIQLRTRAQVAELLAGWEVLEPGVEFVPLWRPDGSTEGTTRWMYAAVARKA